MDSRARRPFAARAFTMVELLVVVGIIVLLISITFAVGLRVTSSGKLRSTEGALKVLDASLSEYIAVAGRNPGTWVVDPRSTSSNIFVQPVFDGINDDGSPINSVGLYIVQCREYSSVEAVFKTLDSKLFKEYDGDASGNEAQQSRQMPLTTVMDGWGNPFRYVHPAFGGLRENAGGYVPVYAANNPDALFQQRPVVNGAERNFGFQNVMRSLTTSDGGIPQGNRPYFYSAGPDGNPATVEDNVYLNTPSFVRQ